MYQRSEGIFSLYFPKAVYPRRKEWGARVRLKDGWCGPDCLDPTTERAECLKNCPFEHWEMGLLITSFPLWGAAPWGEERGHELSQMLALCFWEQATGVPALSQKDIGQNAESHQFAWRLTRRWSKSEGKCRLQLRWERCAGLKRCERGPRIQLQETESVYLMMNKSIRIHVSKREREKKIVECKSA